MTDLPYADIIDTASRLTAARFGQRLLGLYVTGSVAYVDSVPGVSDLDCFAVLRGGGEPGDAEAAVETGRELEGLYPALSGAHVNLLTERGLMAERWSRFMLRYNARLSWGEDIVARIDDSRPDSLKPDAGTARLRLDFAKNCLADALAGRRPACTGELPPEPAFAARKLARYFTVVEGAYFLMARGRFASFRKEDVLPALRRECPGYRNQLDLAERVLTDPIAAGVGPTELMRGIGALTGYMLAEIGNA